MNILHKSIVKHCGFRSVAYSECSRTSKMELIAEIFNGFQPLTIFVISSIFDLGSEYAFVDAAVKQNCLSRVISGRRHN